MWLQLTDTIEHVLAERQLELVSDDPFSHTSRDINSSNPVQLTPQDIRQMTIVTIGQPQTKHMFLLLKAPKGLTSAQVVLDLEADVLIRGARFPVTFWRRQKQAASQLTAPLWR